MDDQKIPSFTQQYRDHFAFNTKFKHSIIDQNPKFIQTWIRSQSPPDLSNIEFDQGPSYTCWQIAMCLAFTRIPIGGRDRFNAYKNRYWIRSTLNNYISRISSSSSVGICPSLPEFFNLPPLYHYKDLKIRTLDPQKIEENVLFFKGNKLTKSFNMKLDDSKEVKIIRDIIYSNRKISHNEKMDLARELLFQVKANPAEKEKIIIIIKDFSPIELTIEHHPGQYSLELFDLIKKLLTRFGYNVRDVKDLGAFQHFHGSHDINLFGITVTNNPLVKIEKIKQSFKDNKIVSGVIKLDNRFEGHYICFYKDKKDNEIYYINSWKNKKKLFSHIYQDEEIKKYELLITAIIGWSEPSSYPIHSRYIELEINKYREPYMILERYFKLDQDPPDPFDPFSTVSHQKDYLIQEYVNSCLNLSMESERLLALKCDCKNIPNNPNIRDTLFKNMCKFANKVFGNTGFKTDPCIT